MRPRTLRGRLAAGAAAAIVVAISVLGLSVGLLVNRELRSSLDRALERRAADVARLSASAPALLTSPGALQAPLGGRELSVEVLDRRRRIVARSLALGGRLLPGDPLVTAAIRDGRSGFLDGSLSGEPIRLYVAPLADLGGPASGGAVLVASSTAEIEATLHRIRWLIVLSAVGAAALGAGLAAHLTGRGVRALRRLATAARGIERSGDARQRLPEPPAAREIAELTGTLNAMLAALDRSQEAERRLLADASHELRTPLTSLRGNAAYIARHGPDAEVLADLEADAARLGRLVDDLLALERAGSDSAPREEVRLDALARRTAEGDPRIALTSCEPVWVLGEAGELQRALDNLVENARVHGPAGGRIELAVRARESRAIVTVSDEGAGVPEADAGRVFDRFWRGPAAAGRPGSGLGLAIVRAAVERHGGRVSVDGSRFTLDLPAVAPTGGRVEPSVDGGRPAGRTDDAASPAGPLH
ncbi:MAG: two-component system, OmpR family, sensor kinase [Miltoncostaeaceae bacterium]|nr:two-component system, OmpR family, sensor kinase [Miltoncostaeaceae bacterium]